jgi:hypothetical protein
LVVQVIYLFARLAGHFWIFFVDACLPWFALLVVIYTRTRSSFV